MKRSAGEDGALVKRPRAEEEDSALVAQEVLFIYLD